MTDYPQQYEPTPYDLGITDDPDVGWEAFPGLCLGQPEAEPEAGL